MGRKKKIVEEVVEEEFVPPSKKKKGEEKFIGFPVYKYRYSLSLQDKDTKNMYRDFDEGDNLEVMKEKAQKEADKIGRDVLLWDYKAFEKSQIIIPSVIEKTEETQKKRR